MAADGVRIADRLEEESERLGSRGGVRTRVTHLPVLRAHAAVDRQTALGDRPLRLGDIGTRYVQLDAVEAGGLRDPESFDEAAARCLDHADLERLLQPAREGVGRVGRAERPSGIEADGLGHGDAGDAGQHRTTDESTTRHAGRGTVDDGIEPVVHGRSCISGRCGHGNGHWIPRPRRHYPTVFRSAALGGSS